MHKEAPRESLTATQPLKMITEVKDIVDPVLYLSPASQVTGEIIHVDGGSLIKAAYSVLSGSNSGFCTPKIAHASLLARTT